MSKFNTMSEGGLLNHCNKRYVFSLELNTLIYSESRSNNRKSARAGKLVGKPEGKMGYLRVSLCGKMKYISHIVWFMNTGKWPALELDHKDKNPVNNNFSNLREVTSKVNQLNRSNNLDYNNRYISVSNSGKFCPGLYSPTCKKIYYFGSYIDIEEARSIRDDVEKYYPDYKLAKEKFIKGDL